MAFLLRTQAKRQLTGILSAGVPARNACRLFGSSICWPPRHVPIKGVDRHEPRPPPAEAPEHVTAVAASDRLYTAISIVANDPPCLAAADSPPTIVVILVIRITIDTDAGNSDPNVKINRAGRGGRTSRQGECESQANAKQNVSHYFSLAEIPPMNPQDAVYPWAGQQSTRAARRPQASPGCFSTVSAAIRSR